jgi:hypothetical protein
MFPDAFNRLPVFLVFVPFFPVKIVDYRACGIFATIRTGLEAFLNTAHLDPAFRPPDIPFPGIVVNLASFAQPFPQYPACPAARTATADFQ